MGRLDDFYTVILSVEEETAAKVYTLLKFKQERAESQLSLWANLKLYSTTLKFVDFLKDYNLIGVQSSQYKSILKQKTYYNFIVKKRFKVSKDIICKYLIPLPQVLSLFSFIYPHAYLLKLQEQFGNDDKQIKFMKRIKIFSYFV